ncbi:restriction endonuclease subunit S [Salmonella enterica subsp. enterica serovar Vinohrady]|uniref:restriction endonuclease subunit S n=1 Tax=Salmonella enterica TaxID=28901 RepID=UPI0011183EBB|nr:restriction endonuclease subunit S [Salmonella enterica]EDT2951449.1 restriction endonuclease subunit S [Salmonella enterica subsp. enterica serovar Vinohrady]
MGNNIKLSEICTDISYGYTASATSKEIGPKFLRITDIQGGTVSWDHVPFCEISKNDTHKYLLEKGDIVIARTGNSTGENYIFDSDVKAVFASYLIRFRVDSTKANPSFVWLQMRTPEWWSFVESVKSGSAQAGANAKVLGLFELELPEREIQDSIVEIAFNLINKQNTNLLINQTLEQMSQTLFKSWFVDFDPVIDNAQDAGNPIPEALKSRAELRQKVRNSVDFKPLPVDIRALFPAEFEETELGWVPKGWMLESVAKSININPSVKLPQNTIAKYVDMKSLPTQGYSISEVIEKPYAGGAKFQKNDTLFARITPCLENGKTGFVDFLDEKETAFGSTEFIVMRGTTKVHYSYVACLARENNFRLHAIQNMVGSSGRQRVQNSCFDSFYIAIPTTSIMSLFSGKVSSYFEKMYSCNLENKSLTALRDTLLPKLISGELSLEDLPDLVDQTEPA